MSQQFTDQAYDRPDPAFWDTYIRGRPHPPDTLFERIYKYHEEHGGQFGIVHDVGAGVGPYSAQLRKKFKHVIVSDIATSSVELAQTRLGNDGFQYRAAKIEDAEDIAESSVDMVFASNMMHFADVDAAQKAIARQLKPGGTFVCGFWGIAAYRDPEVEKAWMRLFHHGMVVQARVTKDRTRRLQTFGRIRSRYDHVPMDEEFFLPGALRIELSDTSSVDGFLPMELREEAGKAPLRVGVHDVVTVEHDEGWSFETNIDGVRDQFNSMSFANLEPEGYVPLWRDLEGLVGEREVEAWWPARVLLATRK